MVGLGVEGDVILGESDFGKEGPGEGAFWKGMTDQLSSCRPCKRLWLFSKGGVPS